MQTPIRFAWFINQEVKVAKNFHSKNVNQLQELLQSKDPKEQTKRVQELIQLVQSPVIDVIIRADPRFQSVEVIVVGGNINFESAYMILDRAREWLRQRELKEVTKPGQVVGPAAEQPEIVIPESVMAEAAK
jgi:hypothetical protein